jgi:hypothetical protein
VSRSRLAVIIVGLVIGAVIAVFNPMFVHEQNPLFNWFLAFFVLGLGVALSIRGFYKQHGVVLVGGIAFTTLAPFFWAKIGQLNLPYAGLVIFGYMTIATSFAVIQYLGLRNSKARVLWCDVTVLYCCLAGAYVIYLLYGEILVLLLVLVGILCPSVFYVLKRDRLSYASVPWGVKV